LDVMGFFQGATHETVLQLASPDEHNLNYTLTALRMAKKANGVSQLHGEVSREMWKGFDEICEIGAITNAQNKTYWRDDVLEKALENDNDKALVKRKKEMKHDLFRIVANQTGKIFDENVLTIVWARRFAAYKRANMLITDFERFLKLATDKKYPIQVIWAGKPYPEDFTAIHIFNEIFWKIKDLPNCAVLTGYELELSARLKKGSDVWLNNPRMYREASGTSGMTAAMNGSVNVSIPDGWVPEFAKSGKNSFIIQNADDSLSQDERDKVEEQNLLDLFEKEVIPTYYKTPEKWNKIVKTAMKEVVPFFDAGRMAEEYYQQMYLDTTTPGKKSKVAPEKLLTVQ
jgi:starch phosphorylase